MTQLPVSAVVLAHQVDQRLYAALDSLNWAAEILLVWTAAEELEIEINFPQLKIIFLQEKLTDFAQLRNHALQHTLFDWVFFLDSDEFFDQQSLPQLEKVLKNPLVDGAFVHRRDVFLQREVKHGEVGNTTILRLIRKRKAKFERTVHEVAVVKGEIAKTNMLIYHFSHRSISDFLRKVILYIQLEQVERAQYQQKFRLLELLFFPPAKFIQNFIFRLGFRDGWRGLIYALMMSIHSFGVRASLYESSHEKH